MPVERSYRWVYVLVGAGYLWLAWNFLGTGESEATVCIFKHATGFACPSCGSTRSLLSVLHGDIGTAMMINPLGILAGLSLLLIPVGMAVDRITGRDSLPRFFFKMEQSAGQPRIAIPLILLIAANWVWNISKGL